MSANNLAGRMEKKFAPSRKNRDDADKRASAVYVLNNELKAILNLNGHPRV